MSEPNNAPNLDPIARLLRHVNVNAVFGAPANVGDVTLIPVAEVRTRFGYGAAGEGEGAGGVAAGKARPLGFIRVAADGVQYEPLFDLARVSLAGIVLAGWTIYWIARTVRAVSHRTGR